jgi:PmbA protein
MNDAGFDPERVRAELEAVADRVLADARKLGADQVEMAASHERALSATVRLGEVETLEHHRDRGLTVTVYVGQRKGSAASADLSEASLREVVERACAIAKYTQDDPCTGLAEAELMAREFPDLDLWHPWAVTPEQAIELAKTCEDAARADERITNSEGASVDSGAGIGLYANSHGFRGVSQGTRHDITCAVIAGSGDAMQSEHWYTLARSREDLESAEQVGRRAAERAVRRLLPRRVKTEQVPVLFVPEVARGLLGHFVAAIRGSSLYRDASFLVGKRGEQIFEPSIRIVEEPHEPRAMGSTAFDGEGVGTRPRDVVTGGVLQGYVLDSYSARKLGEQTTGNAGGVHNLTLEPGTAGFDEMVKDMQRGLVVTSVMGQGINIVTGDYSRGVSGFWVEDGEIAYPVEEITAAGNLADMFRGIVGVGNDVDRRGNIRSGSIMIDRMTVAGE